MTTLYVETIGKGPPLVMLHGWGWHSGIWKPLLPRLAERYQLFRVDLPGFGKSVPCDLDYTWKNIAALLFQQVPAQSTWLGWSMGGLFAWWIAIHHPEKITRLITVASSPRFISDVEWPGMSLTALQNFYQHLSSDYEKTLYDFLELQLRGAPQNVSLLTELKKTLFTTPASSVALHGGLILLEKTDLRAAVHTISCPVLSIFGSNDTLVPVSVVKKITPLLQQGRCEIIKRAGHIPFLSQPEKFLEFLI